MLMEIDEVAVSKADWDAVQQGDEAAKARLKQTVEDLITYMHAMIVKDDEVVVTLRELERFHIVQAVTLHTKL